MQGDRWVSPLPGGPGKKPGREATGGPGAQHAAGQAWGWAEARADKNLNRIRSPDPPVLRGGPGEGGVWDRVERVEQAERVTGTEWGRPVESSSKKIDSDSFGFSFGGVGTATWK